MNPLILAVMIGTVVAPTPAVRTPAEAEKIVRQPTPEEPEHEAVETGCTICLLTFIHNPLFPTGQEMIREECGYVVSAIAQVRARQLQIAIEGNYSWRNVEDWGTWYGPNRIESVVPALQPPCH
jgi:hypothetical protein